MVDEWTPVLIPLQRKTWILSEKTWILWEKSMPLSLFSPQIPRGISWNWTRLCNVRSQWLTPVARFIPGVTQTFLEVGTAITFKRHGMFYVLHANGVGEMGIRNKRKWPGPWKKPQRWYNFRWRLSHSRIYRHADREVMKFGNNWVKETF